MYRHGWYQIAFEHELTRDVSAAAVGPRRLVVLRTPNGLQVIDALCPHRGADLAFGGRLAGDALICPFHGFRIGLGEPTEEGFCVREYHTLVVGGLVFVRLSDDHDNGFAHLMETFGRSRIIVSGFTLKLRSSAEMVIENAFDQAHFHSVHGIGIHGGFRIRRSEQGELGVDGVFDLPPSPWQRGQSGPDGGRVPFTALAFSPGVVVSHLGGAYPYTVVTAATPTPDGECVVRLSLVLTPGEDGGHPQQKLCDFLLRRSWAGIDKDRIIWEHRSETLPPRYTPLDEPIREFRNFCARFAETADA